MTTDYETYRAIMTDLAQPIDGTGIDRSTLKRLYESKLIYLESLRIRCFTEINNDQPGHFCYDDYLIIFDALQRTRRHLHDLILIAVSSSLAARAHPRHVR